MESGTRSFFRRPPVPLAMQPHREHEDTTDNNEPLHVGTGRIRVSVRRASVCEQLEVAWRGLRVFTNIVARTMAVKSSSLRKEGWPIMQANILLCRHTRTDPEWRPVKELPNIQLPDVDIDSKTLPSIIQQLFPEIDASLVLKLPISIEDKQTTWGLATSGKTEEFIYVFRLIIQPSTKETVNEKYRFTSPLSTMKGLAKIRAFPQKTLINTFTNAFHPLQVFNP